MPVVESYDRESFDNLLSAQVLLPSGGGLEYRAVLGKSMTRMIIQLVMKVLISFLIQEQMKSSLKIYIYIYIYMYVCRDTLPTQLLKANILKWIMKVLNIIYIKRCVTTAWIGWL